MGWKSGETYDIMSIEVREMLFRKNIKKCCENCAHSGKVNDETYLCAKKGMVSPEQQCWRFKYDPLKRTPIRKDPTDFSKYDDVDFSL